MALQHFADQYFSKLNPIAKRLYADLNDTKAAYDKLWPTLHETEKEQILNENIIKPEACLKYKSGNHIQNTRKYATKMIVDDHYSYRDEHSAPFSFRTPSQRDLRLFGVANESDFSPNEVSYKLEKEESSYSCDTNDLSSNTITTSLSTLPKTGLDLLDNW